MSFATRRFSRPPICIILAQEIVISTRSKLRVRLALPAATRCIHDMLRVLELTPPKGWAREDHRFAVLAYKS